MKKILPNQQRAWVAAGALLVVATALFPLYTRGSSYLLKRFGGTEAGFKQLEQWSLIFDAGIAVVLVLTLILFLRWHLRVYHNLQQVGWQPKALQNERLAQAWWAGGLHVLWPLLLAGDQWASRRQAWPSGNLLFVWGLAVVFLLALLPGCISDLDLLKRLGGLERRGLLIQPFLLIAFYLRFPLVALVLWGMWRINTAERNLQAADLTTAPN